VILPSKHLSRERALLTVGGRLLTHLEIPQTASALWELVAPANVDKDGSRPTLRYDAFVLALDLLFAIGAIDLRDGLLTRKVP
jgi:hypothetical protein